MTKHQTPISGETLITIQTLQQKLGGISAVWLWRLRRDDPKFPKPLRFRGRRLFWRVSEIDSYMAKKIRKDH